MRCKGKEIELEKKERVKSHLRMPLWFALEYNFHYRWLFFGSGSLRSREWGSSPWLWEKPKQAYIILSGSLRGRAWRIALQFLEPLPLGPHFHSQSWVVIQWLHGLPLQVSHCSNYESNTMCYALEVSWKQAMKGKQFYITSKKVSKW